MAKPEPNNRLSSLDAAFLYLENETTPLHIGAVTLFEGRTDVPAFKKSIASKLHLIPRYRQRIVVPPLNVGHPTWEFDPDFDIDNHIEEASVGGKGTTAQLRRLAGRLFEGVLDREKPLWKIYLINDLEDGNSAMVSLVHHCMVDGVSGAELLGIILDPLPNPEPVEEHPYNPDPLPETSKVLVDAVWSNVVEQFENWTELQQNALNFAKSFRGTQLLSAVRDMPGILRGVLRPMPNLPFNSRTFSGKRKISWSACSFAEARAIRGELGGTVNDVILTTLGGAMRHYLEYHDRPVKKKQVLRVMVPVSVRREDERGALGNRVSMLPVNVPLLEDPVERMRAVTEQTNTLKKNHVAEALSLMQHAWQGTLPAIQATLGRAIFAPRLQPAIDFVARTPALHMVCTNVPGPQIPLYALGRRVTGHFPLVPVVPGMGMNLAIFSYNQRLHFGLVADASAAPDVTRFNKFLDESFVELRKAAGAAEAEIIEVRRPQQRKLPTKKIRVKKADLESQRASAN